MPRVNRCRSQALGGPSPQGEPAPVPSPAATAPPPRGTGGVSSTATARGVAGSVPRPRVRQERAPDSAGLPCRPPALTPGADLWLRGPKRRRCGPPAIQRGSRRTGRPCALTPLCGLGRARGGVGSRAGGGGWGGEGERKGGPGCGRGTQGNIGPPPSLLTPPIQPASPSLGLFALTLSVFLNLPPCCFYLSVYFPSVFCLSWVPRLSSGSFYLCVCVPLRMANSISISVKGPHSVSYLISFFSPPPSPARNFALIC